VISAQPPTQVGGIIPVVVVYQSGFGVDIFGCEPERETVGDTTGGNFYFSERGVFKMSSGFSIIIGVYSVTEIIL
jgi:carbohydrate-binding DOMON domain-containing protein